ncbi:small integral membrane protein 14 [Melitaea cinxia]|uniref:small integral membrane protein 14 n=1 Tax=Melitaea cinxia TaxID=113334 RepID=UPI001E2722F3|nr:small integral membrane protein 14 [Melitaea cinxia]XP_045445364.1 small integral membrane protein 14 [Melitaea cinxia]
MGDEMDPCECLWNHELAMRRLISLLRQGQSYCTDNECLEQLPGFPQPESAGNSFLVMFLMMALAVAMYMMRPRRNQIQDAAKPMPNSQDRDGAPPTPPRI